MPTTLKDGPQHHSCHMLHLQPPSLHVVHVPHLRQTKALKGGRNLIRPVAQRSSLAGEQRWQSEWHGAQANLRSPLQNTFSTGKGLPVLPLDPQFDDQFTLADHRQHPEVPGYGTCGYVSNSTHPQPCLQGERSMPTSSPEGAHHSPSHCLKLLPGSCLEALFLKIHSSRID